MPFDEGLGDVSGYKTVLVRVTGYNFGSTIYGPDNFANVVSSHLSANGIGVNSVRVGQASNGLTGYYDLLISINALASHDDGTIRSLVFQSVVGDLSSVSVDIVSSSQPSQPSQAPTIPPGYVYPAGDLATVTVNASDSPLISNSTLLIVAAGLAAVLFLKR